MFLFARAAEMQLGEWAFHETQLKYRNPAGNVSKTNWIRGGNTLTFSVLNQTPCHLKTLPFGVLGSSCGIGRQR